ncbi:hypothetical protein C1Y40_00281 [Mycobacterium talmoniae]|uniref:Uncharacterized protein n=1 Tax=Mycobacterium talmoniae TaxID=1858794 RepID=A0A2S8BS59_9MYCO|nr:hypothetical protein C1Y40_00281 [Mycobacterium talmoniae]
MDPDLAQRVDERRQRAVADPADLGFDPVDLDYGLDAVGAAVDLGGDHPLAHPLQRAHRRQVLLGERVPHLLGRDLAALPVGDLLDHLGKLDLQPARQHQAVIGLHDVGHPALAGLRVDPDHRLVGAPDVLGVDRQVGDLPEHVVDVGIGGVGVDLHGVQALVDRVLVAAGERGVHQVAAVGMPLGHPQLVAVLHGAPDLVDVGEVDLRVHAAGEQVESQRHQADVAGALPVAEQTALDPIRAGLIPQLGGRDRGAAVVVRVQAQDDRVAPLEVTAHPLDRVGVHVGGGHLHRRRQVEDDRVLRGGRDDVADGVAHLLGVFEFGAGVGLRGVLEAPLGARILGGLLDAFAGALHRDLLHGGPVGFEHHPALQDRRRVVEVHDHLVRTPARLEGALDQLVAALGQHLNGDVGRDRIGLDDFADEVVVGLAGRREPDLDLLVTHLDQQVEHAPLAGRAHRVDQRLVAVAQVHRAPQRCPLDHRVGPGAVGQANRFDFIGEAAVPVDRHRRAALRVP